MEVLMVYCINQHTNWTMIVEIVYLIKASTVHIFLKSNLIFYTELPF